MEKYIASLGIQAGNGFADSRDKRAPKPASCRFTVSETKRTRKSTPVAGYLRLVGNSPVVRDCVVADAVAAELLLNAEVCPLQSKKYQKLSEPIGFRPPRRFTIKG
jgi:hypothetical protein